MSSGSPWARGESRGYTWGSLWGMGKRGESWDSLGANWEPQLLQRAAQSTLPLGVGYKGKTFVSGQMHTLQREGTAW